MSTYRDPKSDNDATNPLNDAPDNATVQAQQDGHQGVPNAHSTPAGGKTARNYRD